jgi:hypothetical protein
MKLGLIAGNGRFPFLLLDAIAWETRPAVRNRRSRIDFPALRQLAACGRLAGN